LIKEYGITYDPKPYKKERDVKEKKEIKEKDVKLPKEVIPKEAEAKKANALKEEKAALEKKEEEDEDWAVTPGGDTGKSQVTLESKRLKELREEVERYE
jgi:hypothetical protein